MNGLELLLGAARDARVADDRPMHIWQHVQQARTAARLAREAEARGHAEDEWSWRPSDVERILEEAEALRESARREILAARAVRAGRACIPHGGGAHGLCRPCRGCGAPCDITDWRGSFCYPCSSVSEASNA